MAHDKREVEESVAVSQALVCNMGAIEDTEAMILAGKEANRRGIPVVLDPVAVGGTEIKYLAGQETLGSGVDVSREDAVTSVSLLKTADLVKNLAISTGSVIALSGESDIISDGKETVILKNGCATMSRITGSGCMVTSMIGAFCGAEKAEADRIAKGTGNATFRTDLIDAVFNMTGEGLNKGARYEIIR